MRTTTSPGKGHLLCAVCQLPGRLELDVEGQAVEEEEDRDE